MKYAKRYDTAHQPKRSICGRFPLCQVEKAEVPKKLLIGILFGFSIPNPANAEGPTIFGEWRLFCELHRKTGMVANTASPPC